MAADSAILILPLSRLGIGKDSISSAFRMANRPTHFLEPEKMNVSARITFDKLGILYSGFDRTALGNTQKYHEFLRAVEETYHRYRACGYFGADPASSTFKLPEIFKIQLDSDLEATRTFNQQLHHEALAGNEDSASGLRAVADGGDEDAVDRFNPDGSIVTLVQQQLGMSQSASESTTVVVPTQHQPIQQFTAPEVIMGVNIPTGLDFAQFIQLTKLVTDHKLRSEEIAATAETARKAHEETTARKAHEETQVTKRHEFNEVTKRTQIEADVVIVQAQELTAQTLANVKAAEYGKPMVRSYNHQRIIGSKAYQSTLLVSSSSDSPDTPVPAVPTPSAALVPAPLRRLYVSLKAEITSLIQSAKRSAFTWDTTIKQSKYSCEDFVRVIEVLSDHLYIPLYIVSKYGTAPTPTHIQIKISPVGNGGHKTRCRMRKVR